MAQTSRERENDAREARLEHMRAQIASGDLTVRQMTPQERAHWDKRSKDADSRATPDERVRRDAARRARARKYEK
jgi:hypothetical protein